MWQYGIFHSQTRRLTTKTYNGEQSSVPSRGLKASKDSHSLPSNQAMTGLAFVLSILLCSIAVPTHAYECLCITPSYCPNSKRTCWKSWLCEHLRHVSEQHQHYGLCVAIDQHDLWSQHVYLRISAQRISRTTCFDILLVACILNQTSPNIVKICILKLASLFTR